MRDRACGEFECCNTDLTGPCSGSMTEVGECIIPRECAASCCADKSAAKRELTADDCVDKDDGTHEGCLAFEACRQQIAIKAHARKCPDGSPPTEDCEVMYAELGDEYFQGQCEE